MANEHYERYLESYNTLCKRHLQDFRDYTADHILSLLSESAGLGLIVAGLWHHDTLSISIPFVSVGGLSYVAGRIINHNHRLRLKKDVQLLETRVHTLEKAISPPSAKKGGELISSM